MVGLESRQMVKIATDPAGEAYILFGHYTCLTTRQRTPFFFIQRGSSHNTGLTGWGEVWISS